MNSLNSVDSPPLLIDELGGRPEEWLFNCAFNGTVDDTDQTVAIAILDTNGSFAHFYGDNEDCLLFREQGYMEEAIAAATVTLRGIRAIVTNPINRVLIMSLPDVEKAVQANQPITSFNVTQTIKAALGEA